jgi:hypothetical protein
MSPRWLIVLAIVLLLAVSSVFANLGRDDWYFTRGEIEAAYRYQLNFGERINNPIKARKCHFGEKKILVSHRGQEFWLSCRFITQTIGHLKGMLNVGAARYLFSLDANHAHLGVPAAVWQEKYAHLQAGEILPAILEDPTLTALYHTAEHLNATDPRTGKIDPKDREWKEKRNVMGYYNGQPIEILPPHPSGAGVGMPTSYRSYGGFRFLASPAGQLNLFHNGGVTVFDISLDFGDTRDDPDSVL